ncbi:MAG: sterol desaturase family protein [Candidatus Obscuribacterales bacterium]|nr:sterol desaturase family protein [Candidatus Obscuribacterales bacterium]
MEAVNVLLEFFSGLSLMEAAFWLFVQNVIQFAMCVIGGHYLISAFKERRITAPPARISAGQSALVGMCVALNTVVAVAGWWLWKEGVIHIRTELNWHALVDMTVLLLLMDFLMYVTHRIAHLPLIYPILHRTHHLEELTRPVSLFMLNPLEVFGYGALWLGVLYVYPSSWIGIVLYLLLNATFGALGHLGIEPFPKHWLSIPILGHLTTSTFHAQHHLDGEKNFGFYTDVWDRLFKTLSETYAQLFETSAEGKSMLLAPQVEDTF